MPDVRWNKSIDAITQEIREVLVAIERGKEMQSKTTTGFVVKGMCPLQNLMESDS